MAKFTILKPPPGHPLHIPTVANLTINLTFILQYPEYRIEDGGLRLTMQDNTILVFDGLLGAARNRAQAPVILQPEAEAQNTHDLLLSLGIKAEALAQAGRKDFSASQAPPETGKQIDELLASSLDMEDGGSGVSDALDSTCRALWEQSSYILPVPLTKMPIVYQAQLEALSAPTIKAGEKLELALCLSAQGNPNEFLGQLPQPAIFYLTFIPGAESYNLHNFIDWAHVQISGGQVICQEWKINTQGACLFKFIVDAGEIGAEPNGRPCIRLSLPLFATYVKGAMCSVTLATAIGCQLREGGNLNARFLIEPSYRARVLYSTPNTAEAFCFTGKSLDLNPPNLGIRGLNFANGDIVNIAQMLQAIGAEAAYDFAAQGQHLRLRIKNGDKLYQILLEGCTMEEMLRYGAFVATDQPMPEWLSYIYLSEQYVREHAVPEADVLLTVKSLLTAFLDGEDYLSMQTILNNLSDDEK